MSDVAMYAVLAVTPAAVLLGLARLLERWCHDRFPARWGSRRPVPQPTGPTLERLAADLRRLSAEYRRIDASDLPARVSRLRTVTLAYDDTLRACCTAVGVAAPPPPMSTLDRLQTEATLAQSGVTW